MDVPDLLLGATDGDDISSGFLHPMPPDHLPDLSRPAGKNTPRATILSDPTGSILPVLPVLPARTRPALPSGHLARASDRVPSRPRRPHQSPAPPGRHLRRW